MWRKPMHMKAETWLSEIMVCRWFAWNGTDDTLHKQRRTTNYTPQGESPWNYQKWYK
jgi:hypothetical protein